MIVAVVQLRVTGLKLTKEELAEAKRHEGNLTFSTDGTASLHLGENPAINHVLAPMVGARLVKMVGDEFRVLPVRLLDSADCPCYLHLPARLLTLRVCLSWRWGHGFRNMILAFEVQI